MILPRFHGHQKSGDEGVERSELAEVSRPGLAAKLGEMWPTTAPSVEDSEEGASTDPRAKASRAFGLASFLASPAGGFLWTVPLNLVANVIFSGSQRVAASVAISHVSAFICLGARADIPGSPFVPVVAVALAAAAIVAGVTVRRDTGCSLRSKKLATIGVRLGVVRLVICLAELFFWWSSRGRLWSKEATCTGSAIARATS